MVSSVAQGNCCGRLLACCTDSCCAGAGHTAGVGRQPALPRIKTRLQWQPAGGVTGLLLKEGLPCRICCLGGGGGGGVRLQGRRRQPACRSRDGLHNAPNVLAIRSIPCPWATPGGPLLCTHSLGWFGQLLKTMPLTMAVTCLQAMPKLWSWCQARSSCPPRLGRKAAHYTAKHQVR